MPQGSGVFVNRLSRKGRMVRNTRAHSNLGTSNCHGFIATERCSGPHSILIHRNLLSFSYIRFYYDFGQNSCRRCDDEIALVGSSATPGDHLHWIPAGVDDAFPPDDG